ncbi:MAG: hypothetical protein DME44_09665 [Verrucomicrobia bacterium]|nr:MAG: hypothetical protein DME44_09665 [Verrucomicrobiota bacterium]
MDNPIVRATSLLAAGIVIGVMIGLAVSPARRSASTVVQASDGNSAGTTKVKPKSGSRLESEIEHPNILLGDIMTVPFQELYGVLSTLSAQQLDELAAQLKNLPAGKETNAKVVAFFKAWAHFDSVTALRAAAGFKNSEAKTTAVQSVITSADAAQAKALAKQIQEWPADFLTREQRNGFLNSLLVKWSDLDPVGAAEFFDTMQVDAMRFHPAASVIAQNWAAIDPSAAIEWARTHSDTQDSAGRQMASTLTSYIFSKDPERAKEWVSKLPDLDTRRQAEHVLVIQMAVNDPQNASEYAATLPADVREATLGGAINYWAASDLAAAGEWIKKLSGPARDEALGTYTYNLLRKDPSAAASWAVTISDPKIRDKSLNGIATFWLNKDPAAASSWIQNSNLPATDKKRLLGLAPGG